MDTAFRIAGRCLALLVIWVIASIIAGAVVAVGLDVRPVYAIKGAVDLMTLFALFPSSRPWGDQP